MFMQHAHHADPCCKNLLHVLAAFHGFISKMHVQLHPCRFSMLHVELHVRATCTYILFAHALFPCSCCISLLNGWTDGLQWVELVVPQDFLIHLFFNDRLHLGP
jgi:hypothetical protein